MDEEFGVAIVLFHTRINIGGVALKTTSHADLGEKTACGLAIYPGDHYIERLDADDECGVDCGRCLRVLDARKNKN